MAKQAVISSQVGNSTFTHPMFITTTTMFVNKCPTSFVFEVILERGNKLRNAMVISALKCDTDSGPALKDTPLPLPKDNVLPPSKSVLRCL